MGITGRRRLWLVLAIVGANGLLLLPLLARHHFAPSTTIVAGDTFVSADATPSPIVIRAHSAGYDGQFYYRIAAAPFSVAPRAAGVRFDHPVWRMQRVLYPLLARGVAAGRPAWIPASLVAVNLAAVAVLLWLGAGLGATVLLAFALWPGFLVALTHDTTELVACALLLSAALAYLRQRAAAYAILSSLAMLTRETAVLLCLGVAATELLHRRRGARGCVPLAAAFAPLVVFGAWQAWLRIAWAPGAAPGPAIKNLGLPLQGVATRLVASLEAALNASHGGKRAAALFAAVGCLLLVAFSIRILPVAYAAIGRTGAASGIAAGWLLIVTLMTLLSAGGPWIDPTAYFRAFSECWTIGWLLLATTGHLPRARTLLLLVPFPIAAWMISASQLR